MKNFLLILISFSFFIGCKKESTIINETTAAVSDQDEKNSYQISYLVKITSCLKDSLQKTDFNNLLLNKAVLTRLHHGKINFIRIPFKGKDFARHFVLLKIDFFGNTSFGVIVNMNLEDNNSFNSNISLLNGTISVASLNRKINKQYKLLRGHVQKVNSSSRVIPSGDANYLPEVVITSVIPKSGSGTYYYFPSFNLGGLVSSIGLTDGTDGGGGGGGNNTGGSTSGYYSPSNPYSLPSYDSTLTLYGLHLDRPEDISYEIIEDLKEISIASYLKCFDNIPDNGAICSIEIYTDLPVNGKPNEFFDWNNGSPGHSFVQIKKTNGPQTIQQDIGFYPDQDWKTVFYTPVTGKFVDNGDHEYNASLKMQITSGQLHLMLKKIEDLSKVVKYDVDDYNCTDFALQIFNSVRPGNELIIPEYTIPGDLPYMKSRTPQGLYQKLLTMKGAGDPEAENITIPIPLSKVDKGNGPCN